MRAGTSLASTGRGRYRGYMLLFREFLPRLRQCGFSDADMDQLLVNNPRSALTTFQQSATQRPSQL